MFVKKSSYFIKREREREREGGGGKRGRERGREEGKKQKCMQYMLTDRQTDRHETGTYKTGRRRSRKQDLDYGDGFNGKVEEVGGGGGGGGMRVCGTVDGRRGEQGGVI